MTNEEREISGNLRLTMAHILYATKEIAKATENLKLACEAYNKMLDDKYGKT